MLPIRSVLTLPPVNQYILSYRLGLLSPTISVFIFGDLNWTIKKTALERAVLHSHRLLQDVKWNNQSINQSINQGHLTFLIRLYSTE